MPPPPPPAFRIGSILWALLIGIGSIALIGSILLPSTKRARIHIPRDAQTNDATGASTAPTSAPATQP